MCQRSEIARRPHRSLRRDARQHTRVHQLDERIDDVVTHAGITARQRRDFLRDHDAHDRVVEQRARSRRMRQDERALQFSEA